MSVATTTPAVLEVRGLRAAVQTPSGERTEILKGIDLTVRQGETHAVMGPNGSGKSTLANVVMGRPGYVVTDGTLIFNGEDVTDLPMYARARKGIGYLPQEPSIFRGLTVEQNIMAILETLDLSAADRRTRLRELLAELNLTPVASSAAYTLSGGERRRAEITRALVMNPRFILLDEPFAGIDPIAVTEIQKIIAHLKERGIGILITDHNVLQTLKITDRAYIVTDGAIFRQGTPEALARDEEVRRIYLGSDFRLD